jgi:hypothetical protein
MLEVCAISSGVHSGESVNLRRLQQIAAVYAFVLGVVIALGYGAAKAWVDSLSA